MHKSSKSIEQARENNVFKFEMVTNRNYFKIEDERYLKIKKSWVENKWMYDCINNRAVVKKNTNLQFVIDRDYVRPASLWGLISKILVPG